MVAPSDLGVRHGPTGSDIDRKGEIMGEYASYRGQRTKIGTCESMYYLRAEQVGLVGALPGNVDPIMDREHIRFRFPFPAEDGTAPGAFEHPLPELVVNYPAELYSEGHGTVSVDNGKSHGQRLSAALPCPTAAPEIWHQYVRAYPARVKIAYQGYRGDDGNLAVIVECAYCDGMWNLPEREDAERLAVSIRSEADALAACATARREDTLRRHGPDVGDSMAEHEAAKAAELHTIADRILAGYRIGA
jgi:hypothetical protein